MEKKRRRSTSGRVSGVRVLLVILLMLIGLGILLYPTISNLWNERLQSKMISNYETVISELPDEKKAELLEAAYEYNAQHKHNVIMDAFDEDHSISYQEKEK